MKKKKGRGGGGGGGLVVLKQTVTVSLFDTGAPTLEKKKLSQPTAEI